MLNALSDLSHELEYRGVYDWADIKWAPLQDNSVVVDDCVMLYLENGNTNTKCFLNNLVFM